MDELISEKEDHTDTAHDFHNVLYKSIQHHYFLTQLYKRHASLPCDADVQFIDE